MDYVKVINAMALKQDVGSKIGVWAEWREFFLQVHRPETYENLKKNGALEVHLQETQDKLEIIAKQMLEKRKQENQITDDLILIDSKQYLEILDKMEMWTAESLINTYINI